jgi:hypothetical protein
VNFANRHAAQHARRRNIVTWQLGHVAKPSDDVSSYVLDSRFDPVALTYYGETLDRVSNRLPRELMHVCAERDIRVSARLSNAR